MRNGKLGVAVIGAGFFGQTHAKTYASLSNTELLAVVDVDEGRARETADLYSATAYTDVAEMLLRDDIDMVSVVTPEPLHRDPVVQCAAAGKHIFLEKPIATTLEDAEAICAAAKAANVKIAVGFESRYGLGFSQIKEAIDGGTLGKVTYIYQKRRSDRGFADMKHGRVSPIMEIAIHDIDLFLWYTGFEEVTEVYCTGATGVVQEQWGQPDWQVINIKTASGALGVLDFGWGLPYKWAKWQGPEGWHPYADIRTEVLGSTGAVYSDMHPMMVRACDEADGWKFPDLVYWPNVAGKIGGAIRAELESFADCVLEDREPLVTAEQAMAGLRIALMAERSYKAGVPIRN
ncbi:MAG: Gfo/Idh/MocA family oxidoreductase [Terrimesophilobacter sp.]